MPFIGEIAALVTAMLWGLSACLHTEAARRVGTLSLNLFRLPLALSFFLLGSFCFGSAWDLSTEQALWLAASGVVGLAVGDVAFYAGAVRIGARLGVLLWELAPAVTTVLAYWMLDEAISPMGIAGITLTMLGVVWVLLEKHDGSMPDMTPRRWMQGLLFALLSVVAQGSSNVLARMALVQGGDVLNSAVVRTSAGMVCLWAVALATGRAMTACRNLRANPGAVRIMALAGFIGPTVGVWLSLVAMKYTKAGIAATLIGLEPLAVIALLALHEKKRPSSRLVVGALISCIGTALLFLR